MLKYIPDMIDSGIKSFKIEGRMRSVYYIATVVSIYRKVIDNYCNNKANYEYNSDYEKVLNRVANRDSITQFYNGVNDESCNYYNGRMENSNQDFLGLVKSYKDGYAIVEQRNYFAVGDMVEFFGPETDTFTQKIEEIRDEDNNKIDIVNHPEQVVKIKVNHEVCINAGFTWKNFEINTQWTGAWNVTRMISESFRMPFVSRTDYTTGGLLQYIIDHSWNPANPSQNAEYPRATWTNGQTNNYQDCSLYEKDASYLRLKTLMVAYNLRSQFLKGIGVDRAQVALSGYNLLTISPYFWGDPESAASVSPTYPLQRTYTITLRLNF